MIKKYQVAMVLAVIVAGTTYATTATSTSPVKAVEDPGVSFTFDGVNRPLPAGYTVLSYQDHTYVPARFVAEQLGAKIDWNESTKTVGISSATPANTTPPLVKTGPDAEKQIGEFKLLSRVSNQYIGLKIYGDYLISAVDDQFNASLGTILDGNPDTTVGPIDLSDAKMKLSSLSTATESFIDECSTAGIDIRDMRSILSSYQSSLANYEAAQTELVNFSLNPDDDETHDRLIALLDAAQSSDSEGLTSASNGYLTYYNKLQSH